MNLTIVVCTEADILPLRSVYLRVKLQLKLEHLLRTMA